jgi:predicted nucleic acid-binding protein
MQVGFIHLSVGRARGLRTDRGQLLNCVPGSVNTRPSRLVLSSSRTRKLPDTLSRLGIAGGAVYDALVALAAEEHGAALATRDARARGTYDAVGVEVIVVT